MKKICFIMLLFFVYSYPALKVRYCKSDGTGTVAQGTTVENAFNIDTCFKFVVDSFTNADTLIIYGRGGDTSTLNFNPDWSSKDGTSGAVIKMIGVNSEAWSSGTFDSSDFAIQVDSLWWIDNQSNLLRTGSYTHFYNMGFIGLNINPRIVYSDPQTIFNHCVIHQNSESINTYYCLSVLNNSIIYDCAIISDSGNGLLIYAGCIVKNCFILSPYGTGVVLGSNNSSVSSNVIVSKVCVDLKNRYGCSIVNNTNKGDTAITITSGYGNLISDNIDSCTVGITCDAGNNSNLIINNHIQPLDANSFVGFSGNLPYVRGVFTTTGDPLFANTENDSFNLQAISPARDNLSPIFNWRKK